VRSLCLVVCFFKEVSSPSDCYQERGQGTGWILMGWEVRMGLPHTVLSRRSRGASTKTEICREVSERTMARTNWGPETVLSMHW
jgi:hypothetical protein